MKNCFCYWSSRICMCFCLLVVVMTGTVYAGENDQFGYQHLSDNEKYVYEQLLVMAENEDVSIDLEKGKEVTTAQVEKTLYIFLADNPEYFWYQAAYTTYGSQPGKVSKIEMLHDFENISAAREALEEVVDDILEGIPADADDRDTALYLHDALAERVTYEQTGHHQTAYGALVDGKAVCAGYARAYQMLLEEAGIDVWTINGESFGVAHAWNIVWIDGKCVYTDVTWDDQESKVHHTYFNMTRDQMNVEHTPDPMFEAMLPDCEGHTGLGYTGEEAGLVVVTAESTAADVADQMTVHRGANGYLYAYADIWCEDDFYAWVGSHQKDLAKALNVTGYYTSYWSYLGNEYHFVMVANSGGVYACQNGTITLELSYISKTLSGENMLWVGFYDEEGRMVGCEGMTITLESSKRCTTKADCEYEFIQCRVFTVDDNNQPVCEAFELVMMNETGLMPVQTRNRMISGIVQNEISVLEVNE